MLLEAAAAPCDAHAALHAAVKRMLLRAAAGGAVEVRVVTGLLCACGGELAAAALSPPEEEEDAAAAGACVGGCGCPLSLRLSWSGRLWSTLQVCAVLQLQPTW